MGGGGLKQPYHNGKSGEWQPKTQSKKQQFHHRGSGQWYPKCKLKQQYYHGGSGQCHPKCELKHRIAMVAVYTGQYQPKLRAKTTLPSGSGQCQPETRAETLYHHSKSVEWQPKTQAEKQQFHHGVSGQCQSKTETETTVSPWWEWTVSASTETRAERLTWPNPSWNNEVAMMVMTNVSPQCTVNRHRNTIIIYMID